MSICRSSGRCTSPESGGEGSGPFRIGEEFVELARRPRLAEIETLDLGAAGRPQDGKLLLRLHALGNDGDAKFRAKTDDGADDRPRIGALLEIANEALVDLDLVEWERTQVAQRRIARAEVIHRNTHTEIVQLVERRDGALVVGEQ